MSRRLFITFALTTIAVACTVMPNPRVTMPSHLIPIAPFTAPVSQPAVASTTPSLSLPQNCFEAQYELTWNLVRKHFLYQARLKDWEQWHHRYRGQLETEDETNTAIDTMLQSLGDNYTYFRDRDKTEKREEEAEFESAVTVTRLANGLSAIHISSFNAKNCVIDTRAALKKLGAQRAYLLDLRGNSGGSIANALEIFSLFASSGKFMEMEGISDGQTVRERWSLEATSVKKITDGIAHTAPRQPNLTGRKPLLVLVDSTTRSAAEMLAGALRDDKRAKLIGERTFGKGVVQRVWQFDQGTSVKITAAKYYLPNGENIQSIGLKPDVLVHNTTHDDAQLKAAVSRLHS